jgi:hypothetical protein
MVVLGGSSNAPHVLLSSTSLYRCSTPSRLIYFRLWAPMSERTCWPEMPSRKASALFALGVATWCAVERPASPVGDLGQLTRSANSRPASAPEMPGCPRPILSLGRVTFTTTNGTPTCGPPAVPPLSGRVDDLQGVARLDLGLGCFYLGGGLGTLLPGIRFPPGGRSVFEVGATSSLAISVTASDGTGPADCTRGAGPARHCLNAESGTDGHGSCASDADCGGRVGACDLDARCFFGTPVPIPMGHFSVCMLNVVHRDLCGTVDLLSNRIEMSASLSSRLYLTRDPVSPCPRCSKGTCSAGQRLGLPCSEATGTATATIECPPRNREFFARLIVNPTSLNSGESTLGDPAGNLCPGQRTPGAFGGEAQAIHEAGVPLLRKGLVDLTLSTTFCVPATGNELIDSAADLPAPAAVSLPGTMRIDLLPDGCSTRAAKRVAGRRPSSTAQGEADIQQVGAHELWR